MVGHGCRKWTTHKLLFCVPEHCCEQFAAPFIWTWLPRDHLITGQTRGRRWNLPYSPSCWNSKVGIYLCPCMSPHSLWHNSFQYERRNRSAPHWPHSPPRWRRDLRCAGGKMPLWRVRQAGIRQKTSVVMRASSKLGHFPSVTQQIHPYKRNILYPLLNFLKGGRMTLRLFTTQCLPTLTLARSPRMMQSFMTIVCESQKETLFKTPPSVIGNVSAVISMSVEIHWFLSNSLLCHSGRCFDSHRELTVCSLCCQTPKVIRQK